PASRSSLVGGGFAPWPTRSRCHFEEARSTMSRVDTSNLQVRIEFMPTTKVAFVRHIGPYETANERYRRFVAWAEQRGLLSDDTRYLGICHDDPNETPADRIRYDCAITVGSDFRPENDVQVGNVFGGEYAITTYRGPY